MKGRLFAGLFGTGTLALIAAAPMRHPVVTLYLWAAVLAVSVVGACLGDFAVSLHAERKEFASSEAWHEFTSAPLTTNAAVRLGSERRRGL